MSDTLTLRQVYVQQNRRPARSLPAAASVMPRVLAGALAMAAVAAVYLSTMATDLYSLDSPELTAAAQSLGIAHEPGYPLYTLGGWTFSHLFPVSTVALRLNLFSAIAAIAAVGVVYAIMLRLTAHTAAAAAGALTLGFSYYFWLDALAAEVYALDVLLFAGLILAALAWRDDPVPARAALVGLVFGLSLANRTSGLLVLPALVAFAALIAPRPLHAAAAGAAGMAVGLLFYLYLPLRSLSGVSFGPGEYRLDGTHQVRDLASWSGFWEHVSAAAFRADAFAYSLSGALAEAVTFAGWLGGAFLVIGVPLGIAGIARQWQRDRALLVLLAGAAAPLAIFFINYGAIDKEFMFLPVYVVWSLWMVVGIDWALEVAGVAETPWLAALALVLPVALLAVNWTNVDLHGDRSVRDRAEATLAAVAPGAIVYGRFTDVAPLQYLQTVEGQRPDVRLVNNWTTDDAFLVALADANAGNTPFYMTQADQGICAAYVCVPVAEDLVEVLPRGR